MTNQSSCSHDLFHKDLNNLACWSQQEYEYQEIQINMHY